MLATGPSIRRNVRVSSDGTAGVGSRRTSWLCHCCCGLRKSKKREKKNGDYSPWWQLLIRDASPGNILLFCALCFHTLRSGDDGHDTQATVQINERKVEEKKRKKKTRTTTTAAAAKRRTVVSPSKRIHTIMSDSNTIGDRL